MAFMTSEGGCPSMSENNDTSNLDHGTVSNQLHLKPCSKALSQGLDKNLVLRRIRHRKTLNKVKSALDSLLPSSQPQTASSQLHSIWLQQDDDAFSAP